MQSKKTVITGFSKMFRTLFSCRKELINIITSVTDSEIFLSDTDPQTYTHEIRIPNKMRVAD